jgi:hypothetical protein
MIHAHSNAQTTGSVHPAAYAKAQRIENGLIANIDREKLRVALGTRNAEPCVICMRERWQRDVLKVAA